LRTFLTSIVRLALRILLIITVAGMVGFQTTSFIAILGAAGLAIGLALQGTLANFAGGVLILIFKPFKVGDTIEAQGQKGVVKEIQIFNTILLTGKGETVILPNGAVSNGTIINVTSDGKSLVEIQLEVDYNTDIDQLRDLLVPNLLVDKRVFPEPGPSVSIVSLKPGSMMVSFKVYTQPTDNAAVYGSLIEQIKAMLTKHGIDRPKSISHTYVHNVPS
jgi:small conductance mechanosensitive channel